MPNRNILNPNSFNWNNPSQMQRLNTGLSFNEFMPQAPQDLDWLGQTGGRQSYNPGDFLGGRYLPAMNFGLSALTSIAGLSFANQGRRLARDQFRHARSVTNTNLANQLASYNTRLEDRAAARAAGLNWSDEERQEYIDRNRLPERR